MRLLSSLFIIQIVLILNTACKENPMNQTKSWPFYVGTYTQGSSEGIYKYALSDEGKFNLIGLIAQSENPSFLAKSSDGRFLLAVNEVSNTENVGYVTSFEIKRDTLLFLDQKSSGGAHPCHITTNSEGYVVVANYTGGNMGLLQLEKNGLLSELLDVQQHQGSGSTARQEGPHAHSGWFTKEGDVISVDLGTNQLWFSTIVPEENKFAPIEPVTLTMETGAGPRHLTFHPEQPWIYVLNELSSSVSLVKRQGNSTAYKIVQTISTLPEGFKESNTCADIHISRDGKFLYASNRGDDSIAMFSVDPSDGMLTLLGHESTRGNTPRNFTLSPADNFLLVANQNSDNIVSFKRDETTGLLTFVDQIEAPTPVCLLF